MPMRLAGGGVVTAGGVLQADVVVEDGRIVALDAPASRGDIDARGCVVLTGGVDPHAHPLADIARPSLAQGGITTVWTIGAESPFAGLEVTGDACLILLHGRAVG